MMILCLKGPKKKNKIMQLRKIKSYFNQGVIEGTTVVVLYLHLGLLQDKSMTLTVPSRMIKMIKALGMATFKPSSQ